MNNLTLTIEEVEKVIKESVPSPFLDPIEVRDNKITITIRDKDPNFIYLTSGAKIIKIFAIEIYRWFCKLPKLDLVFLNIYSNEKRLDKDYYFFTIINRDEIESYYGDCRLFVDTNENGLVLNENWREQMIPNNSNKEKMFSFMKKFVKCSTTNKENPSGKFN